MIDHALKILEANFIHSAIIFVLYLACLVGLLFSKNFIVGLVVLVCAGTTPWFMTTHSAAVELAGLKAAIQLPDGWDSGFQLLVFALHGIPFLLVSMVYVIVYLGFGWVRPSALE